MKVSMDKKTGIITSDYGWQLEFQSRSKIRVHGESDDITVNIEILGDGGEIILYNDLELRGVDKNKAAQIINVVQSILNEMNFMVTID